jgi:epoxyqueuosine reductase
MTMGSSIPITTSAGTLNQGAPGSVALTQTAVRAFALAAGFTEAGMVALPYPETDRDAGRFAEFIDRERSGTMDYLARRNDSGELVRSRVDLPFPWARSAIVCLASYNADAPLSIAPAPPAAGWIARYAWTGKRVPGKRNEKGELKPSDYHKVLLKRLHALEARMHEDFGDFESRAYVDTGPVMERALARAAGVGWTGKNTCLIHPKLGSWNFLAVIVTSLRLPEEQAPLVVPDRCGSCTRCIDACPTDALIAPHQMDATRCISYLTIEYRGDVPENLAAGIGRQVFGCDICQDVCPWNRKAPIGLGDPASGSAGDMVQRKELVNPDLAWLASLENVDFERLFNGSPVRRTGFWGLRRNIAIAIANAGLTSLAPRLRQWIDAEIAPASNLREAAAQTAARNAAIRALGLLSNLPRKNRPTTAPD